MNATSAKCGHVKRRLLRNQPLTGKVLEFAISVIAESAMAAGGDLLRRVADKLRAGEQLDDYELHLMIDVLLPHKRLAHPEGAAPWPSEIEVVIGEKSVPLATSRRRVR